MSSIRIRSKRLDGNTQIRILISHPMENGRRKNEKGEIIPAHYIQELWIDHNNDRIIRCQLSGSISKNPYFDFLLKGGEKDDKITVFWIDNLGETDHKTHIIN